MTKACYFCGDTARGNLERHHIVPRRFDGSDKDENIVTLCPTCHEKLESLYNKRFYDTLGVEKSTDVDGICHRPDCTADAEEVVTGSIEDIKVCLDHYRCGRRGCGKNPTYAISGEGKVIIRCRDHARCHSGTCANTDTMLVEWGGALLPFCQQHAEKHR